MLVNATVRTRLHPTDESYQIKRYQWRNPAEPDPPRIGLESFDQRVSGKRKHRGQSSMELHGEISDAARCKRLIEIFWSMCELECTTQNRSYGRSCRKT